MCDKPNKNGKGTIKVRELAIKPCEECPEFLRVHLGCPFEGHAGKGTGVPVNAPKGAPADPWRTCPEGLIRTAAVGGIWADLEDYKRGAMGDVLDIQAPRLALLRTMESEMAKQDAWIDEQLDAP